MVALPAPAENFSEQTVGTVDGALWSLVVEVHFYVLLPFLALAIARIAGRSITRATVILIGTGTASTAVWLWRVRLARRTSPTVAAQPAGDLPVLRARDAVGAPATRVGAAATESAERRVRLVTPLAGVWRRALAREPLHDASALDTTRLVHGDRGLRAPAAGESGRRLLDWSPLAAVGVVSYSLYVWHSRVLHHLSQWDPFPDGSVGLLGNRPAAGDRGSLSPAHRAAVPALEAAVEPGGCRRRGVGSGGFGTRAKADAYPREAGCREHHAGGHGVAACARARRRYPAASPRSVRSASHVKITTVPTNTMASAAATASDLGPDSSARTPSRSRTAGTVGAMARSPWGMIAKAGNSLAHEVAAHDEVERGDDEQADRVAAQPIDEHQRDRTDAPADQDRSTRTWRSAVCRRWPGCSRPS